jgi:hypothetical protein
MHEHWIPRWVEKLPWWIKWAFMAGAGVLSAFLPGVIAPQWQVTGVALGAVLFAVACLGAVWHGINDLRQRGGKANLPAISILRATSSSPWMGAPTVPTGWLGSTFMGIHRANSSITSTATGPTTASRICASARPPRTAATSPGGTTAAAVSKASPRKPGGAPGWQEFASTASAYGSALFRPRNSRQRPTGRPRSSCTANSPDSNRGASWPRLTVVSDVTGYARRGIPSSNGHGALQARAHNIFGHINQLFQS